MQNDLAHVVRPFHLTVNDPQWPSLCACCVAPMETTVKLKFEQRGDGGVVLYSRIWEIPYCSKCAAHVETATQFTNSNFRGPWLYGALAAMLASLFVCARTGNALPFLVTSILALVVLQIPIWRCRIKAQSEAKAHCSSVGPAVQCVAHRAHEGADTHTFQFANGYYLKEFHKLNSSAS